jgi:tetratricopeptide (TPR) repeat protein
MTTDTRSTTPLLFGRAARHCLAFALFALIPCVVGCSRVGSEVDRTEAQSSTSAVSFTKDVAPIIFARCSPCHQPGQGAPFSLLTYEDVSVRARLIADKIAARQMPPWPPEPGYGSFANERRLSEREIEVIQRWVDEGVLEGDPAHLIARPPRRSADGWRLGQPDLVVEMPQPYTLRPGRHSDIFRNFVIPLALPSTRYVRAVEFRSGTTRPVIHHAVIGIDRTRASRRLDARDAEAGFDDMLSGGVQGPDGHFLSWTPGKAPFMAPDDMAWRLEPGTDLILQLHMLPAGREDTIKASLGFFFADAPPKRQPVLIKLGSKAIDIPAGEADYTVTDEYTLPADVDALSIYPHAHYLARDIQGVATLPDGTSQWLIWIKDWNFNWQDEYRYARPLFLPRGTTVRMRYSYDNSPANPRNPHRPPQHVRYGPHSSDEMGDLWLQVLPRRSADVELFAKDYVERELRANVTGAEARVRSTPGNVEALNWLSTSYMRVGRIREAVPYLNEAIRLNPDSAEVHHNLGSALQELGERSEALEHFRVASRLSPRDDRVVLSLANALNAGGAAVEAVQYYRQVLAVNPESAEAHNNLGIALGSQGQLDEAILHFRRAIEIAPGYADAYNNLGIGFSARGQREEAISSFRRALELRPNDENARQNLEALLQGSRGGR